MVSGEPCRQDLAPRGPRQEAGCECRSGGAIQRAAQRARKRSSAAWKSPRIPSKASSASSSAGCAASSSIADRTTCTATSPSSTSVTATVRALASTTPSAPILPSRLAPESASPVDGLVDSPQPRLKVLRHYGERRKRWTRSWAGENYSALWTLPATRGILFSDCSETTKARRANAGPSDQDSLAETGSESARLERPDR